MDLPNLRRKPTYDALVVTLKSLELSKHNWSTSTDHANTQSFNDPTIKQFAMAVIRSGLSWLSPEQQDEVYDLASKRIAERCGRSAMPTMTRTWTIPKSTTHPEIALRLREPALTGDTLGHKTWGTSFVLAKKLEEIGRVYFKHLLSPQAVHERDATKIKVLELGSGTGLIGLAAAAIWAGAKVTLTDLADVVENLDFNIQQNLIHLNKPTSTRCLELNWYTPSTAFANPKAENFGIIIAADPLYDDDHPEILAQTVEMYAGKGTMILIAVPMRDETTRRLAAELDKELIGRGFVVEGRGKEVLMDDDWEMKGEDREGVEMLWSIWERENIGDGEFGN